MRMSGLVLLVLVCVSRTVSAAEPIVAQAVVISLIDDVSVASQDSGIVSQIAVQEGATVSQGDVLGELDDLDVRLDRQRVLTELQMAKLEAASRLGVLLSEKSLAVAAAELVRAEKSNQKYADSVSQTELDKLRFVRDEAELQILHAREKIEQAELRVALKQAELEIADRRMNRRRFLAPLAGQVVKVERQPGEWIQPGDTFCRIIRTDRLRAEGFVALNQGNVQVGQKVELQFPSSGPTTRNYAGVVTFVDPEVNPITGQYRIWAEVENTDGTLRPGQRPVMVIATAAQDRQP